MNTTTGTFNSISCPHCNQTSQYALAGITPSPGVVTSISRPCRFCQEMVYYLLQGKTVTASDEPQVIKPSTKKSP